jgi:DegV family protein with EDD domain
MGVRIITDSTSDISLEQAKKMGISIVPLKVIFGDKEYREGIEISMDAFYSRLAEAEKLPTTSQPSPDDFLVHFNQAKEAGDSVVVILIASKLSGTYQSAVIARDMAEYSRIFIIDSLNTITGLRLLINHAVTLRNRGVSADCIADTIESLKEKVVLLAVVDTLEYLYKGGRLSKSSAILGSLLNFKPVITLKDGAIGVVGKERGTNKAIARILDAIDETGAIDSTYPVYFGYTFENSKTLVLQEKVTEKYRLEDYKMFPVGCVVGTHVGPGACVITYIKK